MGKVKVIWMLLSLVLLASVCRDVEGFLNVSWSLPDLQGKASSTCEKEIQEMYTNLRNMTLWAVEMSDSSGKGTTGLLRGSTYNLGNFGQCLGEERVQTAGGPARQYCLAQVTLVRHVKPTPLLPYQEFKFDPYGSAYDKIFYKGDHVRVKRSVIHWGLCVPASCSAPELTALLQRQFKQEAPAPVLALAREGAEGLMAAGAGISFEVNVANKTCQKEVFEAKPLNIGVLLFYFVIGIPIGLVVVSSCYHWYLIQKDRDYEVEYPRIVRACSMIRNLHDLNRNPQVGDVLQVLWGIRFLSIFFIIMDHRAGANTIAPVSNREFVEETYHTFMAAFISHGDLLVDSFLAISGLLCVHSLLGKKDIPMNVPLLALYRYIRLVPAYAVVILFTALVLPLTGSGPLWPLVVEPEGIYCRQNWWTNFLMLNNYINVEQSCMLHSWYIPVDFHYFLVSAVVCTLFRKYPRQLPRITVLSLLTLVSVLTPAIITFCYKLPGTLLFFEEFINNPRAHPVFKYMYITTHTRGSPYFIGMISGYLIVRYQESGSTKRLSTRLSTIGTLVALGGLLASMASVIVLYEPSTPYNAVGASFFAALHRPVWSASLCLLIGCCAFGNVPLISTILSWHPWVPLGKLVFGAYLVHVPMMYRGLGMTRQPHYMDIISMMGQAFGDVVISFTISLVLYLTVEGPIKQIVNMIILSHVKSKTRPVSEDKLSQAGYNNKGNDVELDVQDKDYTVTKSKDKDIIYVKDDNINENNKDNHY